MTRIGLFRRVLFAEKESYRVFVLGSVGRDPLYGRTVTNLSPSSLMAFSKAE